MNTEKLIWRCTSTNNLREEIREQVTAKIWRSKTDGRIYVKTMFGTWYDITDTNYHAEERASIKN